MTCNHSYITGSKQCSSCGYLRITDEQIEHYVIIDLARWIQKYCEKHGKYPSDSYMLHKKADIAQSYHKALIEFDIH